MTLLKKIVSLINWVTSIMILFLTLLVSFEVFTRYIFNAPITVTGELTTVLFPWIVFLASVVITLNDDHIAITAFRDMLPPKMKKSTIFLTKAIMLFFSIYMVVSSFELTKTVVRQTLPVLGISKSWLYIAVTIAFFAISFILICQMIFLVKNKEFRIEEENGGSFH